TDPWRRPDHGGRGAGARGPGLARPGRRPVAARPPAPRPWLTPRRPGRPADRRLGGVAVAPPRRRPPTGRNPRLARRHGGLPADHRRPVARRDDDGTRPLPAPPAPLVGRPPSPHRAAGRGQTERPYRRPSPDRARGPH